MLVKFLFFVAGEEMMPCETECFPWEKRQGGIERKLG